MGQPTMDDVAKRAGVSRSLVSLVMRESPRVSDLSRKNVLAAARELGYRPNLWARNQASGQTHTIGIMLNDLHNPYFTEMAEGAAAAATDANMQVLITSGWQRENGDAAAIEALLELRTRGLILGAARVAHDLFGEVANKVPVVSVAVFDRPDGFDTVCNDESIGAELVVDHLVDLGHERIAHITGGDSPSGPERRTGFIDAMVVRGLAPIIVDGAFEEHAGHAAAMQLMALREPPTAIFAANDLCASGVLTALRDLGVSVPYDVSVVGYDDTLLAGVGTMSLTTVHQPRQHFGRRAMELLLERIDGRSVASHELIEPRLVTRSSTGPTPREGTTT
jgi:DNA-binding LacI/PurR family transcriptional regulator